MTACRRATVTSSSPHLAATFIQTSVLNSHRLKCSALGVFLREVHDGHAQRVPGKLVRPREILANSSGLLLQLLWCRRKSATVGMAQERLDPFGTYIFKSGPKCGATRKGGRITRDRCAVVTAICSRGRSSAAAFLDSTPGNRWLARLGVRAEGSNRRRTAWVKPTPSLNIAWQRVAWGSAGRCWRSARG
jgi:hypothetical protein